MTYQHSFVLNAFRQKNSPIETLYLNNEAIKTGSQFNFSRKQKRKSLDIYGCNLCNYRKQVSFAYRLSSSTFHQLRKLTSQQVGEIIGTIRVMVSGSLNHVWKMGDRRRMITGIRRVSLPFRHRENQQSLTSLRGLFIEKSRQM